MRRNKHLTWLMESGQISKAAAIIESEDPRRAILLYLKARRPGRAARLLLGLDELVTDESLVNDVVAALKASELMELAGEIYERIGNYHAAIAAYGQSNIYARALELGMVFLFLSN
jgi:intraflagellar transport protein 172